MIGRERAERVGRGEGQRESGGRVSEILGGRKRERARGVGV